MGWARNATFLAKIILSGIISKVCLATTSNKLERPLNRDDEKSSVPLSVKPRRPRSLVVKACLIDDRSSPSLAGSRRGDWQSERLYQNNLLNLKIKKIKSPLNCIESVIATQEKGTGFNNSNAYVKEYCRLCWISSIRISPIVV